MFALIRNGLFHFLNIYIYTYISLVLGPRAHTSIQENYGVRTGRTRVSSGYATLQRWFGVVCNLQNEMCTLLLKVEAMTIS